MTSDPARPSSTAAEQLAAATDDLTVRFPRCRGPALTQVSWTLRAGEQVLLLGPSGSGKSTLLHSLTGVVPHTMAAEMSGSVLVRGVRTTDCSVAELSRHVGVLAQDPSTGICLPDVEQELALPLENRAADPATIDARIDRMLSCVRAQDLRTRRTVELSGGEAQRLALAASLVAEPDILLLDEPTSMLDATGVVDVRTALADAIQRYQPAVVIVEHRLDQYAGPLGVSALPARSIVLDQRGRLVADGPTDEVFRTQARTLHRAGCWLPLEAELFALTGVPDGIDARPNRAFLAGLATSVAPGVAGRRRARPGAPVLSARNLTVPRPDTSVLLDGVNLDLHPGEIVAVLGPNGVGKSTLLRTLAGLAPVAAGALTGPRPSMVFQNAEHQFLAHTVTGDIGHGLDDDVRESVVARQLHTHRLEHVADQNPFRLSGGEKRRLSIAAMLVHERPVLLLDEPTLGLDRRDSLTTTATLREVAAAGCAVVFSTHELRLVATLADRVVVLADGGVLADGPVFDVLRLPDVLRSARLDLPPLLDWLLRRFDSPTAIRNVLLGVDR